MKIPSADILSTHKPRVLIVDDNAPTRKLIREILENESYSTELAENGLEAWGILQTSSFDLVLCDLHMPAWSGLDLLDKVRAHEKYMTLFFIFLTSAKGSNDLVTGLSRGADDYIGKPFQKGELLARLGVGWRLVQQRNKLEWTLGRLAEAESTASMISMGASVAHEMNSPLCALDLGLKTLQRSFENEASTFENRESRIFSEALSDSRSAVNVLTDVSRSLRNLQNRGHEVPAREADLHRELETALTLLSHRIFGTVKLCKELHPELPPVFFPEGRLVQAFLNLVGNALDAVGNCGTITLRTGLHSKGMVYAEVSDNGPGISPARLEEVFRPFYSGGEKSGKNHESGSGFGLGLSITLDMVERNGGQIESESKVGKGATFRLLLKKAQEWV